MFAIEMTTEMTGSRPDVLGDAGHEGMEEPHTGIEDVDEDRQRALLIAGARTHLCDFEIPVTELVPDEVADLTPGLAELEALHEAVDVRLEAAQPGENPAVL